MNHANVDGGVFKIDSGGTLTMDDCHIFNSYSYNDAIIYIGFYVTVELSEIFFTNNTAGIRAVMHFGEGNKAKITLISFDGN